MSKRELLKKPKSHPVLPLPENEIGYCMSSYPPFDDCLRAAIATATQVPIEQVPDLRIDARLRGGDDAAEISRSSWNRIAVWATRQGLRLVIHELVPVERSRWIGVCPAPEGPRMLDDHCLVMSHDRLVFDPAISVRPPPGHGLMRWSATDVAYGISFDGRE